MLYITNGKVTITFQSLQVVIHEENTSKKDAWFVSSKKPTIQFP